MIRFACENGHRLKAADGKSGQQIRCPVCKVAVTVPASSPARKLRGSRVPETAEEFDRELLQETELRQWEVDALDAYHVAEEVRSQLRLLGLVLLINLVPWILFASEISRSTGLWIWGTILGVLLIEAVLIFVAYNRPTETWIMVCVTTCVTLVCGCIPILVGLGLFLLRPRAERYPYENYLTGGREEVIDELLGRIFASPERYGWLACETRFLWKRHPGRMYLFDNAALFLNNQWGQSYYQIRGEAHLCECIEQTDGTYRLTGLADFAIVLSPEVAQAWLTWRGEVDR